MDRRKFVQTLIIGGAGTLTGVPFERMYAAPPPAEPELAWRRIVHAPAHALRDGQTFPIPPPCEERDIVIVGAGPTSLCAAYHLRDFDFLMLEKEPKIGGNAQRGFWKGIYHTEGTAYMDLESPLASFLAQEFDLHPTLINSTDAMIVGTTIVRDVFSKGAANLPWLNKAAIIAQGSRKEIAAISSARVSFSAIGC